MDLIHIKEPDKKTLQEIVSLEEEAFEGNGNVDLWIIKALIRYGLVFVVKVNDEIVSIIEYMQSFNKKSVFLYGISTLKKHRHKGYANFLLNETEKYLKKLDFKEIELTVDPKNEIAKSMYRKHGYNQEKYLKDEYGKDIDRFVFKKNI
ncbi:MAG: GNAT family N-acetyltransferase [Fusobacterium sp.]|nr:GNAT family N-acetyltransferase [Fusobacterium sp.]